MAELDDGKLKNLDKELQNLNSHLDELDVWLRRLRKNSDKTFDTSKIKSWIEQLNKTDLGKSTTKQLDKIKERVGEISKLWTKATQGKGRGFLLKQEDVTLAKQFLDLLKQINVQKTIDTANSSDTPVSLTKSVNSKKYLDNNKKITEEQKKQNKELEKQERALNKMVMTGERLKNALVAAFGVQQITRFAREMIKVRGEFEMSEIALGHIVGNSEKTQLIWKKTMNLAVNSPLTAQQLTRATKQLAAFRIETDRLYDTTRMLADVSVGLGVDMERLILAYGHTKSSGFLRGMYARQFATAGVNIYGELADYYTKMEGQLVTFRDVYERISKKLVSFADVEKVFEKITSKGGTFYNMQQVLTNTVQGQINKIRDSWQQALNDIGKSTQGTIRGVTDIILNIVKNWRVWLSVIEATTAALITFKAVNVVRTLTSISYASDTASKSTKRLAASLKSVFSNFKGNLPSTLTAIGVAAVTVFATMYKHMKDFNREIDEQSLTLYEAQQKMYDYQKRVEANNEVIKDSASNSEKLKAAREDNLDVLLKLQQEYPELYDGVKQQADGEVELTKKIEAHNESLREQIRLNEKLKQTSIFEDPFEKDTKQYFDQLDKWRKKILSTQKDLKLKLLRNELNEDEVPTAQAIIGIDTNDILVAIQQYNEILSGARQIIAQNKDELEQAYRLAIQELSKQAGTAEEINRIRFRLEESNLQREAAEKAGLTDLTGYTIINTDVHSVREFERESEVMVKEMLDGFELMVRGIDDEQKKIAENYNNNFADYFQENKERLLEMVTSNELDVNETIRTFLESHGQALTDENKKVWNILLNEALIGKHQMEDILKLSEVSWVSESPFYQMLFKKASERLSNEGYYDFFASYRKPTKGGDDDDDDTNKTYKSLDELLNLLKTMNSEYNKLSKSAYGYAKSNETVMKVFRESFKDIFKTTKGMNELDKALTMIKFDTLDITSKQGLANAFQELFDFLEKNSLWNQFGKDADKLRAKLQKTIDMQEVEVGMDVQIKLREDFGKEMEKMFSDYDLTLDLEKLELPTDELAGIFGFDYKTLNDLRKAVDNFYNKQLALGDDPTELVKQVEGYYKKIDEMEKKELRERLKTYTKYLADGRAEALKIHMDELKKMSELDELYQKGYFTDTQYKDISDKIKKETNEKLAKNDWQQFKESEFYVTMFEDLSKVSSKSIDIMVERLKNLRSSINDLDPKQAKEIVRVLDKLEKAKMERSPLKSFVNDLKTAREWIGRKDRLSDSLGFFSQEEEYWSKEQDKQAQTVAALRIEYDKLSKTGNGQDAKKVKERLDLEEETLRRINKMLESTRENLDKTNKEINDGYAALIRLIGAFETINRYSQQINSSFESFKTMMESLGADIDTNSWDAAATTFNALASTTATIASSAAKFAAGDYLGGSLDAIKGVFDLVKLISEYEDRKIDRQIQKQEEIIDNLTRAYERLENQIEKTYDTMSYMSDYNEMTQNIYEQIAAINQQIALEESKKNTDNDKIQEYKDSITDLEDKLDELKQKQIEVFGGIGEDNYRSAAEGFVDAWKSAFLETGDGLQGLQDHFDEFLEDWFVKQATMRIAGSTLAPLFEKIDQAVDQYGFGGTDVTWQELSEINELKDLLLNQTNEQLRALAGVFGLGGEGSLSGLAAGIQGMTEEHANILEAYLNSVRGYTANIDLNVSRIADMLGAGGRSTNPMLEQITLVAHNTDSINTLLQSVTKSGHTMGGSGLKVFVN